MSENMPGFGALFVLLLIYLIPSIIAASRGHQNGTAIFVLNIFTGWTALGWIIALVWSFTGQSNENGDSVINRTDTSTAQLLNKEPPLEPNAVSDEKKCPYCAETIKAEAVLCRYCGKEFNA